MVRRHVPADEGERHCGVSAGLRRTGPSTARCEPHATNVVRNDASPFRPSKTRIVETFARESQPCTLARSMARIILGG